MTSYVFPVLILVAIVTVYSSPVEEKPAFSCPENEEYYKCSQIHCYKNCTHLVSPPACPSVSPDCYKPACECKDGELRNEKGVCVPETECAEYKSS